jgi:hypothetical protein
VLGVLVVALRHRQPEKARGLVPEATDPFGIVARANVAFSWLLPSDGAPVRIEVFDTAFKPLWSSKPTRSGTLRPPESECDRWPEDDLLWRPVAVPEQGDERPGDYAAFSIVP